MVRFAKRLDLLDGSDIGDLLRLIARPDIISFAGGLPAPELFPVEELKQAGIAVMEEMGTVACQYSSTEGLPALRQKIVERMEAKNNIHLGQRTVRKGWSGYYVWKERVCRTILAIIASWHMLPMKKKSSVVQKSL